MSETTRVKAPHVPAAFINALAQVIRAKEQAEARCKELEEHFRVSSAALHDAATQVERERCARIAQEHASEYGAIQLEKSLEDRRLDYAAERALLTLAEAIRAGQPASISTVGDAWAGALQALRDARGLLAHAGCPVDWIDVAIETATTHGQPASKGPR